MSREGGMGIRKGEQRGERHWRAVEKKERRREQRWKRGNRTWVWISRDGAWESVGIEHFNCLRLKVYSRP